MKSDASRGQFISSLVLTPWPKIRLHALLQRVSGRKARQAPTSSVDTPQWAWYVSTSIEQASDARIIWTILVLGRHFPLFKLKKEGLNENRHLLPYCSAKLLRPPA